MPPTVLASRAILAEYTHKTLRPVEVGAVVSFVLVTIGTALLITYVSAWWWALMVLMIAYGLVGSMVWFAVRSSIDHLRPEQTPEQRQAVRSFIGQLDTVANTLGVTQFGLLIRVIQDVMAKSDKNVLTEFAHDSHDLKSELEKVVAVFRPSE